MRFPNDWFSIFLRKNVHSSPRSYELHGEVFTEQNLVVISGGYSSHHSPPMTSLHHSLHRCRGLMFSIHSCCHTHQVVAPLYTLGIHQHAHKRQSMMVHITLAIARWPHSLSEPRLAIDRRCRARTWIEENAPDAQAMLEELEFEHGAEPVGLP